MKLFKISEIKIGSLLFSSQICAFVGLLVLAKVGLVVSDFYSVVQQIGTAAHNGFVLSVVYGLIIGRPGFSKWGILYILACCISPIFGFFFYMQGEHVADGMLYNSNVQHMILVFYSIGGAILAFNGVNSVRLACLGRAEYLAGILFVPNLLMAISSIFIFFFNTNNFSVMVPALAWLVGNLAVVGRINKALFSALAMEKDRSNIHIYPKENVGQTVLHGVGLVVGSIVGTVFPVYFLSAVKEVVSGGATALYFLNRIGGVLIGNLVNSKLLVRYSWKSGSSNINYTVKISCIFSCATSCVSVVLFLLDINKFAQILYILAWMLSLIGTPFLISECNSRRKNIFIFIKSCLDLVLAFVSLWILRAHPSLVGYFCVFVISQAITGVVCGLALKLYYIVFCSGLLLVSSIWVLWIN